MKYLMLLVIVAYLNISSETEMPVISACHTVKNLEHGGFTGTVVSDKCNTLSLFDLKGNVVKKRLVGKSFCEAFNRKYVITALDRRSN